HSANALRVASFFKGFLREAGAAGRTPQRRAPSGKPIYTRGQILQMATMRRQGKIDDAAWARWEYELIAAGREGRIVGALDIDGIPVSRYPGATNPSALDAAERSRPSRTTGHNGVDCRGPRVAGSLTSRRAASLLSSPQANACSSAAVNFSFIASSSSLLHSP